LGGDVQDRLELDLTLDGEVGVGKWCLVVLSDGLVEAVILIFGDLALLSEPDGLDLIDGLPLPDLFGNSLLLLFLGLFLGFLLFALVLDLILLLNLLVFLFLSFSLSLILVNLLSDLLGDEELDWVLDEL
jgi:hypothetical protein